MIDQDLRWSMIEENINISIRKQCELLFLCRSSYYYVNININESDLANKIREIYLSSDCRYGYRKITKALRNDNINANHKKVLRIMKESSIQGIFPRKKPNTSLGNKEHKIYPYLLANLMIHKANQVWATDITYIRINNHFMYFIAIIDLYSRYIVAYDLSHNLEADFCVDTLKSALRVNVPEIFNSDQGAQFTSGDFVLELERQGIKISMDHKGRCFDNILVERLWRTLKQEVIYYYRPETIRDLEFRLNEFVFWYNDERLHQSLNYKTPKELYFG